MLTREIKFRGKRVDNGEWVYGSLSMVDTRSQKIGGKFGQMFICNVQNAWSDTEKGLIIGYWIGVHPESVGQYMGLKDKNGVEIYEGDEYKTTQGNKYKVMFISGSFTGGISENDCAPLGWNESAPDDFVEQIEIIGNIHENK